MADKRTPPLSQKLIERLVAFASQIIDLVEMLPENRVGSHIASQLLRSGSSPAPNYAEAVSAESTRDFIHKLGVALKELRETHVWLKILEKRDLLSPEVLSGTTRECNELIAIFVASVSTAKRNLERGHGR